MSHAVAGATAYPAGEDPYGLTSDASIPMPMPGPAPAPMPTPGPAPASEVIEVPAMVVTAATREGALPQIEAEATSSTVAAPPPLAELLTEALVRPALLHTYAHPVHNYVQ